MADDQPEPDDADDDGEEAGPGMDFGMAVGAPIALLAVLSMFVGPRPLFELTLDAGPLLIDSREVGGYGPIPYISGSTLVVGVLAAVAYPWHSNDPDAGYEIDLALGLIVPTIALVALVAALVLLFPVVHFALAGELVTATVYLLVAAVVVAVAARGWMIAAALILIATIYLAIPAVVGVYGGSFARKGFAALQP